MKEGWSHPMGPEIRRAGSGGAGVSPSYSSLHFIWFRKGNCARSLFRGNICVRKSVNNKKLFVLKLL